MTEEAFAQVEEALRTGGADGAFEFLAEKFRAEKKYPLLFELRLMQKRRDLGMPLLQVGSLEDVPADTRPAYEKGFIDAARETGGLFLGDGDIPRAWSYYRAIGEPAPVAAAIEKVESGGEIDAILEIAYHERVNPKRGFELILANHGLCRAITSFGQFPGREGREESLKLLVRTLYRDICASMKRTIASQEGAEPAAAGLRELMAGRDWLFEGSNYYVDTSHLVSIVRYSLELEDRETLALAVELTEYGARLSPMFQFRGDPPFQNAYEDCGHYLHALLGEDTDAAIAHFRKKVEDDDPNDVTASVAQALVGLLAHAERFEEAIEVHLQCLRDSEPSQLGCPTVLQLCQEAKDFDRLRNLAREKGDLLGFLSGAIG
ncbi:MAG: hypothetical protein EXQ52_04330 [Bryobacterales bacterium]|nr:hypothetical protein [Bryobacterales bacterium]